MRFYIKNKVPGFKTQGLPRPVILKPWALGSGRVAVEWGSLQKLGVMCVCVSMHEHVPTVGTRTLVGILGRHRGNSRGLPEQADLGAEVPRYAQSMGRHGF